LKRRGGGELTGSSCNMVSKRGIRRGRGGEFRKNEPAARPLKLKSLVQRREKAKDPRITSAKT